MRTTLHLDDDIFEKVKQYAETRSVGLGRAVSELVRRGLTSPVQTRIVSGLHVVNVPPNSPPVDSGHIKALLEDERL